MVTQVFKPDFDQVSMNVTISENKSQLQRVIISAKHPKLCQIIWCWYQYLKHEKAHFNTQYKRSYCKH